MKIASFFHKLHTEMHSNRNAIFFCHLIGVGDFECIFNLKLSSRRQFCVIFFFAIKCLNIKNNCKKRNCKKIARVLLSSEYLKILCILQFFGATAVLWDDEKKSWTILQFAHGKWWTKFRIFFLMFDYPIVILSLFAPCEFLLS